MIQINATTHTKGSNGTNGLTVNTGSVLDITPHFLTRREPEIGIPTKVEYDVAFDVHIYKSLASYEAGDNPITNAQMKEYNIGFTAKNVDVQALTSITDLLTLLNNHVINGDTDYPGVGLGNAVVVYPFSV